ncbi:MAG TPA: hypothetical protein VIH16_01615 [Bellilinea sp.]
MKTLFLRFMIVATLASVALMGCSPKAASSEKVLPATLEDIDGSEFKRVVLTEKAASRISVQTAQVGEATVDRKLRVGGEVISPMATGASGSSAIATAYIRVRLNMNGSQEVDRGKQAFIIPLTGVKEAKSYSASSVEYEGLDDDGEDDDDLDDYYLEIDEDDYDLTVGDRVFVDLPLFSGLVQRKVIPYSAVIYGVEGETWVYLNPEPLVYVRQAIVIDYIEGDQVYLLEGPELGSTVVTMGVAELFGAETGVSK